MMLGMIEAPEPVSGEPFTEEQIQELQLEVVIVKDQECTMVIERKEAPKPEYIYIEEIPMSEDLQRFCQERCKQYKVGYAFFLAMLESESDFGTNLGNRENIKGPMQINKCNWNRYPELDVDSEYDNYEIGIRMMAELLQKYQSADKTIMGYKAGESKMLEMVENGERLLICDTLVERANYWEGKIEEVKNEK